MKERFQPKERASITFEKREHKKRDKDIKLCKEAKEDTNFQEIHLGFLKSFMNLDKFTNFLII